MGDDQPHEGYSEWLKSHEFNGFLEPLCRGERGPAIDALVGAVIGVASGLPLVGVLGKEGSRRLRALCECATDRLLEEYARVREREAAERHQQIFMESVEVQLRPWFFSTLKLIADLREGVQRIDEATRRTEEKVDAHYLLLQQIAERVALEKGIAVEPLRRILARLGESDVPFDQIPERLAVKADEFLVLREQFASHRFPELTAIRERAMERLNESDLDGARVVLREARQLRIVDGHQDPQKCGPWGARVCEGRE